MKIGTLNWSSPQVGLPLSVKAGDSESPLSALGKAQLKRLRDIQDGLQRLKAMPDAKSNRRQAAMDKVGLLKQRLDEIKMLLLHASPEQAKALAQELKNIAKELSSAGKSLETGAGGNASPNAEALDAVFNSAPPSASSLDDGAQGAEINTVSEVDSVRNVAQEEGGADDGVPVSGAGKETNGADEPTGSSGGIHPGANPSAQGSGDRALRALLADAKKLLKEVIGILKPKLASADREAKHNMQAAEKSLAELGKALAQGMDDNLYTAQGDLGMASAMGGLSASLALGGVSVDLAA